MGRSYRLRLLFHHQDKLVSYIKYIYLICTGGFCFNLFRNHCICTSNIHTKLINILMANIKSKFYSFEQICVNVPCNFPSLTQRAPPPSFTLRKRNKGTKRGARRRNTRRTKSSTNTRRTRRYQEPLGPVVAAKCHSFTDFSFSSTRRRNRSSTKAKGRS